MKDHDNPSALQAIGQILEDCDVEWLKENVTIQLDEATRTATVSFSRMTDADFRLMKRSLYGTPELVH